MRRFFAPALVAVATLSLWMIHEAQHLAGGGKDRSHLSKPPPDTAQPLESSIPDSTPSSTRPDANPLALQSRLIETSISQGDSLGSTLSDMGLSSRTIHEIVSAISPLCEVDRIAAGSTLRVAWKNFVTLPPSRFELQLDHQRTLVATKNDNEAWHAEIQEAVIDTQTAAYAGIVTTTLWNSATIAGMDPNLIHKLAEVFAWQIDFNREVQEGDRWRLTVERRYVQGKAIGFGDIIAAEYENDGQVYTAVRHIDQNQRAHYFAPDGSSLRRMFLKSPLKYGRITSGFSSRRFHPVLKVVKPHLGVDYGAPIGTPVMAVGDGVITLVGARGGSGNMIEIKHNSIYRTAYKHLSRFAAGMNIGSRVQMGQIIGYVGATGLATGPHLHFELAEGGKVRDPQGLKFPRAEPVAAAEQERFLAASSRATSELPPWSAAVLSQRRMEATDGIPNE